MEKDEKVLSMLGLCRKAGKLFLGYDSVVEADKAGKIQLILLAADISERSKRNVGYSTKTTNTPIHVLNTDMKNLGEKLGSKTVGIIGIADIDFFNGISKILAKDKLQEESNIVD